MLARACIENFSCLLAPRHRACHRGERFRARVSAKRRAAVPHGIRQQQRFEAIGVVARS